MNDEISSKVGKVIQEVREEGLEAVRKYTEMFDGVEVEEFEVTGEEKRKAVQSLTEEEKSAIEASIERIERFHREQRPSDWNKEFPEGFEAGEAVRPVEKAGCYVPGGNYPLPSSALMTVVPARIAGVEEITVCTPPGEEGKANMYTVAAAEMAGADRIFKVGGIQAIAAMAFGTGEFPGVDKMVGPGNKWVTEAKKQLYGEVGIDFLAGPSELLIISDGANDPEILAADLLSQAEHDTDSRTFLISLSREEIENTREEIEKQLKELETSDTASKSIEDNLETRKASDLEEAVEISDSIAPEHLELQVERPKQLLEKVRNAGTVFLGRRSVEALGDYTTGTNHVLPTGSSARFTGGLGVRDFVKIISWERQTEESFKELKDAAVTMSKIESLPGHTESIRKRGDPE
ncbi:MAG: histidinol dehydrogenase [Candidatus Nanohalobium sp.]